MYIGFTAHAIFLIIFFLVLIFYYKLAVTVFKLPLLENCNNKWKRFL